MANDPSYDRFVGLWELDPAQSDYQVGTPPQTGLYRIAPDAKGTGYMISMNWTDAQGRESYAAYTALPDGVQYAYENSDVADFISMTRLDEYTLDSAIIKGGRRIAYSLRELSDDGQAMTITQSGFAPDGTPFDNRSVYVRQA
ncbi:MAG: hypothetical protein ABI835_19560 [Chloroflexota bacterium]